MGIFSKIKGAIWGTSEKEAPPTTTASVSPPPVTGSATAAPSAAPAPKPAAAPAPAPTTTAQAPAPTPAAAPVDVAAVLDAAVKANGQKLDWRKSIVDLMKALDIDSSLGARKELADELGYNGDKNDSAKMNIWLHKQVIQKLKDNGGKVPADLV